MEKQKTLKEKLLDIGEYFIPFYGGQKAIIKGKPVLVFVNAMCTAALSAALIVYGLGGRIDHKIFNFKEIDAIEDQRIERKANERKDLRHQFYLAIDSDKNGMVDEQEFSHFYDWSGNNRVPTMNLKRIVESYKAEQK